GPVMWRSKETVGVPAPAPATRPAPAAVSVATAMDRLVPDPPRGPLASLHAVTNMPAPNAHAGTSARAIDRVAKMSYRPDECERSQANSRAVSAIRNQRSSEWDRAARCHWLRARMGQLALAARVRVAPAAPASAWIGKGARRSHCT